MKKHWNTLDEATEQYNTYYGKCPTQREIEGLYHKYRFDWKQFDSFTQWLQYHSA
jgi:hypothetical protein